MTNQIFTVLIVCSMIICISSKECPISSKVQNCTPKCLHDSECHAVGGKCCPNICNGRSCAQPNILIDSGRTSGFSSGSFNDKYSSSSTGSYCGNVKCSPYEKCRNDPTTKRPVCVRT